MAAVVAVVAAATALRPDVVTDQVELLAPETPQSSGQGGGGKGPGAQEVESSAEHLTKRIEQTLQLTAYPDLDPPVDDLGIDRWYQQVQQEDASACHPTRSGGAASARRMPTSPRS